MGRKERNLICKDLRTHIHIDTYTCNEYIHAQSHFPSNVHGQRRNYTPKPRIEEGVKP